MSKGIHFRITCISKDMIHTIASLKTETISETFGEVVSGRSKYSELRSIEFEPIKESAIEYNEYTV